MPLAGQGLAPVHGQRAVTLGSYNVQVVGMTLQLDLVRVFYALIAIKQKLFPRPLSQEEASLLEHFRSLSEKDRIAVRYMCTAIRETSKHHPRL